MTAASSTALDSPFVPHRLDMEAELPEFMTYPDFTSISEVSRAYTIEKLKTILADCGLPTTGSPAKAKLVEQVCSHAVVQIPLLGPDHVGDLSDVQVIAALQQLGQSERVPRDLEARRTALRDALAAADSSGERDSTPPETSPDRMHKQLLELVGALQQQIQRQAQDTAALRSAMTRLESRESRGQGRDDGRDRQDEQDEEEVIIEEPDAHARRRRPVDDPEPPARPGKVAKGDGVASIAAAFVQALDERLGTGGLSSGEDGGAEHATTARIERTAPALVDLRQHKGNPHTLGALVRRATTFEFSAEQGLAAVTWRMSIETKEAEIHAKITANASAEQYTEGEAEFFEHIAWLLTLATKYAADSAKYRRQRDNQREAWSEVWTAFRKLLRHSTRHLNRSALVYRIMMEDFMSTALGVGFSPAQLRTLRNTCNLRKELGMSSIGDLGGKHSGGGTYDGGGGPHRGGGGGGGGGSNNGSSTGGGGGGANRQSGGGSGGGSQQGGGHHGSGAGGSDGGKREARRCGANAPQAKGIVGVDTSGAVDVVVKCNKCHLPGDGGLGHRRFECPLQFAEDNPGKAMPGFDTHGAKIPGAWVGNNITADTKQQWLAMQKQGFFKLPPVSGNPASMPGF